MPPASLLPPTRLLAITLLTMRARSVTFSFSSTFSSALLHEIAAPLLLRERALSVRPVRLLTKTLLTMVGRLRLRQATPPPPPISVVLSAKIQLVMTGIAPLRHA